MSSVARRSFRAILDIVESGGIIRTILSGDALLSTTTTQTNANVLEEHGGAVEAKQCRIHAGYPTDRANHARCRAPVLEHRKEHSQPRMIAEPRIQTICCDCSLLRG